MSEKPDPEEFYALYGRCINEWAFIDSRFCDFFSFALGADQKRAAIVYYSWGNFGQRQQMTDKLMRLLLSEPDFSSQSELWERITKEVDRILPFRNLLAHEPIRFQSRWTVHWGSAPERTEEERLAEEKRLGPRNYHEVYTEPKKILTGKPPRTIRKEDLEQHLKATNLLRSSLDALGHAMNETLSKIANTQKTQHPDEE